MLRRSLLVAIATTMCCLALGGVARATADILQFYHAGDAWIGALQILSLAGGAIAAVLLPEAPARLARRLLGDTTQIAFALVVWESRWLWKQYAEASSAG